MHHFVVIAAVGAVACFAVGMALFSFFEDNRRERPYGSGRPPPRDPSPPPSPPRRRYSPPVRRRRRSPSPPPRQQPVSPPSRQQPVSPPPRQQPVSPPPRQQAIGPPPSQQVIGPPPSQRAISPPPSQRSPSRAQSPNQSPIQRGSPPPNVTARQMSNRNRSSDRTSNHRSLECIICESDEIDDLMTFLPCRCSFMCRVHAMGYLERYNDCPVCHRRVDAME